MSKFRPTIPAELLFSWQSQVCQYPYTGEPGISYMEGPTEEGIVDCLLYRNDKGHIIGILNHYSFDAVTSDGAWEKKGNVNIWIHRSYQRQGIGRALWEEAVRRWGVRLQGQRMTPAGAAFAEALTREEN
jgi:ribosomal protein S18 acetylase RimI-like enzyme